MVYYWLLKVRIHEKILKKIGKNILFKEKIFLSTYKILNLIACCWNCITAPHYQKLIKIVCPISNQKITLVAIRNLHSFQMYVNYKAEEIQMLIIASIETLKR